MMKQRKKRETSSVSRYTNSMPRCTGGLAAYVAAAVAPPAARLRRSSRHHRSATAPSHHVPTEPVLHHSSHSTNTGTLPSCMGQLVGGALQCINEVNEEVLERYPVFARCSFSFIFNLSNREIVCFS